MSILGKLLTELSKAEGADGLLVTSEINQRYLTDFPYTDGYVLVTPSASYVFADSRYIEAAKAAVPAEFEVVLLAGSRRELLHSYFQKAGIRRLLFEDGWMTVSALESMKRDFSEIAFAPAGRLLDDLRAFKEPWELERIQKAQSVAEAAFDHILGFISPEKTEKEVALELEFYMRSHGADDISFQTIAVSGTASSLPHGVPRDLPLQKGFLTMDYGAKVGGYCSDMTRTVCIGHADAEMKRVYDTVLNAQTSAIEAVAAGKSCADIDRVARDIIDRAGYAGCFGHGLGHGVGLLIHEAPRLSPSAGDARLTKGHVVTVEPGIYLEGKYGVRIEDMVYVGENESVNLTHVPKELIEL